MPVKVTRTALEVLGQSLGEVTPRGIGTLYPPFFRNNWTGSVEISTSWQTFITKSYKNGAEERISKKQRPSRLIQATSTGMTQEESTALQMSLMTMMGTGVDKKEGVPFPLYSDRTTLLSNSVSTDTNILCNTLHRRFYKGQRIAIVPRFYGRKNYGVNATALYAEIANVQGSSLELKDPLGFDVTRQDHVYPMIDIHPNLDFSTTLLTDNHMQVRLSVLEYDGVSALPGSWGKDISTYFDYYKGYPIFSIQPNWATSVHINLKRDGSRFRSGNAAITEVLADRTRVGTSYNEAALSRKEAWDILRFFDSRRGRALPFWLIQPLNLWDVVSLTTTHIDIPNYDYLQNLIDYITDIVFTTKNGDTTLKGVASITDQGSFYRITFDTPLTSIPLFVISATPAWLSRFERDTLTQVWGTETVSTNELVTTQVLKEEEVTIPNI